MSDAAKAAKAAYMRELRRRRNDGEKAARAAYMKEYRKRNRDRQRGYEVAFWERKAAQAQKHASV